MDNENSKGSGKQLKVHFDVNQNEVILLDTDQDINPDSVSLSSSSSSSSSSDSLIESVAIDEAFSNDPFIQSKPDIVSAPDSSTQNPSPALQNASSTQTHQVQTLGLPGYDPNRIPTSIFSSKPANPMEWSVASNESLFSIHVGNNSFSRDHSIMLNRSDELSFPGDMPGFPGTVGFPISQGAKGENKNENPEKVSGDTGISSVNTADLKMEIMPTVEEFRSSISVSYRSDESNHSIRSFQFPILAGTGGGRESPATVYSNKQQSQPQAQPSLPRTPKTIPEATSTGWFSCFYCCAPCS